MKSLFYKFLRSIVKFYPNLGEFLLRLRPGNDHFKRYAQYARAQRITESNITRFDNEFCSESKGVIDLTVIITSFNYASYIEEAIDSVIQQEFDQLELIVVEDNSSDTSAEVIQKRIATANTSCSMLKLDTNGGLSHARNVGLRHAKGEYVFILDADNVITAGGLGSLINAARSKDATAVFGKLRVVDEQLRDLGHYKSGRMPTFNDFREKNQLDAMALYQTSYLRETGGFDVEMLLHGWGNEDWEKWTEIFSKPNTTVEFVDEVIGLYRTKPGSMVVDAIRSHTNNAAYIQKKYYSK